MNTDRQPAIGALLTVRHLTTVFDVSGGPAAAVADASFDIGRGETLCLVGESGSGKTVAALSLIRLVPPPGRIAAGSALFHPDGSPPRDLLALSEADLQRVRGASIGFVFQEPMSALNPVFTVGEQIAETLRVHHRAGSRADARGQAIELLRRVHIPDPGSRVDDYPHQLSGGLRQRVLIALAIACRPALLIADEPTTALDASIQRQVLELLREMRDTLGLSLLLITHDLANVAGIGDRVAVMYAGQIVEQGHARDVLREPRHPYTRALLASIPGGEPGRRLTAIPGTVPPLGGLPPGCAFAPRCTARVDACEHARPALVTLEDGREVRCFLYSARTEPSAAGIARHTAGPS